MDNAAATGLRKRKRLAEASLNGRNEDLEKRIDASMKSLTRLATAKLKINMIPKLKMLTVI